MLRSWLRKRRLQSGDQHIALARRSVRLAFEPLEPRCLMHGGHAWHDDVDALAAAAPLSPAIVRPAEIQPRLVTVDAPSKHIVNPGQGYDGVVRLRIDTSHGTFQCTGSLIGDHHILTAAHCVTDHDGNLDVNEVRIFFDLKSGRQKMTAHTVYVHPDYNGDLFDGGDVSVIELDDPAPAKAERYKLYTENGEVGRRGTKVGYGYIGDGFEGQTAPGGGRKRIGRNEYDALADDIGAADGTQLAYDFDNGVPANDAFGVVFGIHDLGLGNNEVNSAIGDSGGPTFFGKKIAGVTSYGTRYGGPDVDNVINSSFGEISVDTRVSHYAGWIQDILDGPIITLSAPLAAPHASLIDARGANSSHWEAEGSLVRHDIGRAVESAWLARPGRDEIGFLSRGPNVGDLTPGTHVASFQLWIDEHAADNRRVASLDVYDATTGESLAKRNLRRGEFDASRAFQTFTLGFTAPADHELEFRVRWFPAAKMQLDWVRVDRVEV